MANKRTLFLGFGDIATRVALKLPDACVGISRRPRSAPANLEQWCDEVNSPQVTERLRSERFDRVVITFTPRERSDEGYKVAYVDMLATVLPALQAMQPEQTLFVSSTAVYGGQQGEWLDESAECTPLRYNGRRLLQAESLLMASGLPGCVLRLAGIYGPGRDFLQRQVRKGKGGSPAFTNRIHAEDAAGFIVHLLQQGSVAGVEVYNVSDSQPAPGNEVRAWLAREMGVPAPEAETASSLGKRVSNKKMLATGYRLHYPDYRAGYASAQVTPR